MPFHSIATTLTLPHTTTKMLSPNPFSFLKDKDQENSLQIRESLGEKTLVSLMVQHYMYVNKNVPIIHISSVFVLLIFVEMYNVG
jgi:hypothetical protein